MADVNISQGVRLQLIGRMKDGSQAPTSVLRNVVWTVSDESVAEIINGYLVPKIKGQVTVTAEINGITASSLVVIGDTGLDRLVVTQTNIVAALGSVLTINTL